MKRLAGGGVGTHLRRYRPFYVFAALWGVMITLLPTAPVIERFGEGMDVAQRADVGGVAERGPAPTRPGKASAPGSVATATAGPGAAVPGASGVTTGDVRCVAGVRQISSAYAAPCVPRFTGSNGGATFRGVTEKTITVVSRDYEEDPSSRAINAVVLQAGQAPAEVVREVRKVFLDHFNKTFELYGRKVVIEDFHSSASVADELRNTGREQACADATVIAEERKAFAVLPPPANLGFGPFSECAAERKLVVPIGPYGFPESWYRRYHPYVWGVQMSCDRISHHVAEYVGKRLNHRKAKWARDPVLALRDRTFGFIGPDIEAYAECVDLAKELSEKKYGAPSASEFRYSVDPSTMPTQAAQAVSRFKARGVTTLILGSDFLMNINLTNQARAQDWGPEWVIIGAGFQDFDNFTRMYDQDRIDGHLFGLSELGATADIQGAKSEPALLYKKITGRNIPKGTDGDYFTLIHLFNMLQAAGPNLTPQAVPAGMFGLPPAGKPELALGLWRFEPGIGAAVDHTAVDDSREVYWDGSATGYDGDEGTFRETYGGRRFLNGQWPAEEPPVYPGGS